MKDLSNYILSILDDNIKLGVDVKVQYDEVVIGDNVWIGDKSTILSGVQIGDSCIIAANSVVTKSLPSFCIAAGNPCKILKIIDKKNIESE